MHELDRIRQACENRQEAGTEYREALQAARDAGYSLAEISQAAGITRQGVRKLTRPRDSQTSQTAVQGPPVNPDAAPA